MVEALIFAMMGFHIPGNSQVFVLNSSCTTTVFSEILTFVKSKAVLLISILWISSNVCWMSVSWNTVCST